MRDKKWFNNCKDLLRKAACSHKRDFEFIDGVSSNGFSVGKALPQ